MDTDYTSSNTEPTVSDLYFLIYKFLSGGPLKETLRVYEDELSKYNLLPNRLDWNGVDHKRSIEDMGHQYLHVRPDYLLQLCCRASNTKNEVTCKKISSLFSLTKNSVSNNSKQYNFDQLLDYVKRIHLRPARDLNIQCNLVNILRGRETSGPVGRRWIVSPKLYSSLQFQRRTLGHLSAVYCLLFDHSGRYIITGADDLLIKLWSSRTGRLIATFRGASSEITDIAINLDNSLLAAGSIDRILRIWDLQSGIPVAVLPGHTGMITSVKFCPTPSWNFHYLVTTSTDGSVAFWAYNYDAGGKVRFIPKPTMYQEKMRPGQAQMICSSFSTGGTFLATGSADHHVRVYYMKGDEGPHRILETEAHSDRVDSIQWAHSGLRFLSGSKDGTAIIWSFECQQWKTLYLHMTSQIGDNQTQSKPAEDPRKMKVTMVAWDQSDQWAVTAVSDHTLKIWNTRSGHLYKVLSGHTDEVYVLEAHPHDRHVMLSAGHDGQLFIWDIMKGTIIWKFLNTIENQGYGAIFDVKWSPDGNVVAASDSHGHILIFGFGNGHKLFEQLPRELFFHTDYRPLVRDNNNHVLDEQTQVPPHMMPPPFLVDIDGNPYPPVLQKLVPGREHCKTEQLVPSIVIGNEGNQEVIQVLAEESARFDNSRNENADENRNNGLMSRAGSSSNRRVRDEGIRQSTGNWQSDPNMKWKKHILMQPLRSLEIARAKENVDTIEALEMQEYRRQLCQRPHMINTSSANDSSKSSDKKKNSALNRLRVPKNRPSRVQVVLYSASSAESDETDSTGHSDWVAEEDVNLESPKRTRRRKARYNSDDEDDEDEEDEEDDEDDENSRKSRRRRRRNRARESSHEAEEDEDSSVRSPPVNKLPVSKQRVPEAYRTSEWLTEVRPRKTPYFPQLGDQVVYFPQGHHLYLDAVRVKKVYEVNSKTLPWTKMVLRGHEFAKVVGIQYEIKPPRVCNLKLALLDEEGKLTGKIFHVKYHDMPDVLDFFVLKQNFDVAISRDWQIGDKFRCMIDDGWWIGEVVCRSTACEDFPNSPFLCYEIKWDNGELERLSPWDMEPIDESRIPENPGEPLPVLEEELQNILYQPSDEEWPKEGRDAVTEHISAGLSKVMELAIAEPFLVPVDLAVYPSYARIIEYPVDLSTIKARFDNKFYRRVTAAQFDVRHLATNAEKFNEKHSVIVKHARILTELCLRVIKQCTTDLDVNAIYHQLVDTYDSTDTEIEVEIQPTSSTSRLLRTLPKRYTSDWKSEAISLLSVIWDCEDSMPFRTPVNTAKFTDYKHIIKTPMDLSTVKERLFHDHYETPEEFRDDMRLIFQNSRTYNTNSRSRIYVMTVRLAAIFEEHMSNLINNWKLSKRRRTRRAKSSSLDKSSTNSSSEPESKEAEANCDDFDATNIEDGTASESDSEDNLPLKRLKLRTKNHSEGVAGTRFKDDEDEEDEEDVNVEDSDGSYKPEVSERYLRKRKKVSSSESDDDDDDDDNEEQNGDCTSSDSDDDQPISRYSDRNKKARNLTKRSRKITSDSDDSEVVTSISSRGRLRRLNPKVRAAFMKK